MTLKKVAVIGSGPSGIYAAKHMAKLGLEVTLINRDIKPGGLGEYGIFHSKDKMKDGLRKQFGKILQEENITYFGNVSIGNGKDISWDEFQNLGYDAILVAIGAQQTKWLGNPGEDLDGVYHAKDLVYHYNLLPPNSQKEFPIGNKVALIGAGNVMVDIAHWCIRDLGADEVVSLVRRGPNHVKFTKKEFSYIFNNLDVDAFDAEMERVRPEMEKHELKVEDAKETIFASEAKALPKSTDSVYGMKFLSSVVELLGDDNGRVSKIKVQNTALKRRDNGALGTQGLDTSYFMDVDTVVFCVGDKVDNLFGLPMNKWNEYAVRPEPAYPIDDISYEAFNLETSEAIEGVFLAGWARQASTGLVGEARKDGVNAAKALLQYLETQTAKGEQPKEKLLSLLNERDVAIVEKDGFTHLTKVEADKTTEEKRFFFSSNEEMLAAIKEQ
jgi:ferredoxin/flavodoxin---NADP+ reductase